MEVVTEKPSANTIPEGYKRSEIGVIPKEWSCEELGAVGDVVMGQSPPGSSYNKGGKGVPLINGPTEFTKYTPKKIQWTTQPTKFCKPKDILLCVRGSSTGRINISDDEYCIGRGIGAIRAKANFVNKYLEYQLRNAVNEIVSKTSGSTFPNIPGSTLRKIQIPLPPTLKEQQAIAMALSDVDALIAELDALIEKKHRVKKGAMQQLLTGRKRLPGFNGEWETVKLSEKVNKFVLPMRDKPKQFNGNIPWCRIEDFNGKYLRKSKENRCVDEETVNKMNLKVFPKDTLLVSCSANLGRCAIIKEPLVTNQTFIGLVCNVSKVSEEFLYYYMTFNADELNNLSSGTTISYLSRDQFKEFEISVPQEVEEQKAIAGILSDMDAEIQALQTKRSKYEKVKQGMMQELLTGKTRLV